MSDTKKKKPTKATTSKKTTAKKSVKSTGNKLLNEILQKIAEAKKKGEKSVVVLTTNQSHHKANTSSQGLSVSDIKPKVLEAYKYIFCKFNVSTKLVSISDKAVEWIVTLK